MNLNPEPPARRTGYGSLTTEAFSGHSPLQAYIQWPGSGPFGGPAAALLVQTVS